METKFKNSEKRNELLRILRGTTSHPSAEWIYQQMRETYPKIGLATVYRNLKILLEQNLIFKVDVGDGTDHFDAGIFVPHDHAYCKVCGCILDIPASYRDEFSPDGFSVESHSLILFGKCKKCKQEETLDNKFMEV